VPLLASKQWPPAAATGGAKSPAHYGGQRGPADVNWRPALVSAGAGERYDVGHRETPAGAVAVECFLEGGKMTNTRRAPARPSGRAVTTIRTWRTYTRLLRGCVFSSKKAPSHGYRLTYDGGRWKNHGHASGNTKRSSVYLLGPLSSDSFTERNSSCTTRGPLHQLGRAEKSAKRRRRAGKTRQLLLDRPNAAQHFPGRPRRASTYAIEPPPEPGPFEVDVTRIAPRGPDGIYAGGWAFPRKCGRLSHGRG